MVFLFPRFFVAVVLLFSAASPTLARHERHGSIHLLTLGTTMQSKLSFYLKSTLTFSSLPVLIKFLVNIRLIKEVVDSYQKSSLFGLPYLEKPRTT